MYYRLYYFLQMPLFLVFVSLSFFSCVSEPGDVYSIEYSPRQANHLWATNCYQTTYQDNGHTLHNYYVLTDTFINVNNYFLSASTGNKEILNLIGNYRFVSFVPDYHYKGTSIPALESEIGASYKNYENKISKSKNTSSGTSFNVVGIEYRTNGIKEFTISALDCSIFGKNPHESLNDYFEIARYSPDFIASADTKSLLYGYSDTDKPTSIDEWLSLKPLAQPTIHINFKSIPTNLPITTRFKIDMVTDDGLQLSDTTKSVTLTN